MTDYQLIDFAKILGERFSHIGVVYLFGSRARGDNKPDSDWDVFVCASDEKDDDDLLRALMAAESELRPSGFCVDLFVARGAELLAAWGVVVEDGWVKGLIPESDTQHWREGYDYVEIWKRDAGKFTNVPV